MKKVKTYMCEFDSTPSKEDVSECIAIAKNDECIVKLVWVVKWSGTYERYFYGNEDAEKQYEKIKNIVYGL